MDPVESVQTSVDTAMATTRTLGEVNCRVLCAEDAAALERAVRSGVAYPPMGAGAPQVDRATDSTSASVGGDADAEEGDGEVQAVESRGLRLSMPWIKETKAPPDPLPNRGPLSWHARLPMLATRGSEHDVIVHDLRECRDTGTAPKPIVLCNEYQKGVRGVAWRPCAGKQIAVACDTGVCLWKFGKAPVPGFPGFAQVKEDPEAAWMVFVDVDKPASTLSWSPNGKHLAVAHEHSAGLQVWDVSRRTASPVRASHKDKILMLRWSPCGAYLWTGCCNGVFYLWDTFNWTYKKWNNPQANILDASWGPDGKAIVVCFYGRIPTVGVYLSGKPGVLVAHVLPVEMPGLLEEADATPNSCLVEAVAWDGTGERVVAVMGHDHSRAGQIAIYSAKAAPVLNLSLIGYLVPQAKRLPPSKERSALEFLPHCSSGSLVAHCCGGKVDVFPLIFSS